MGAAFVLFDHEMSGVALAKQILEMFGSDSIRKEMQRASRGLGRPEACARIVDIALSLKKNLSAGALRVKR
jgi:UDP-N-acetylglucosamine:LPS N-acetylglucosamine transferase